MNIRYQIFRLGLRGVPERVDWQATQSSFDFSHEAVLTLEEKIRFDAERHNNFQYIILPVYGQPLTPPRTPGWEETGD